MQKEKNKYFINGDIIIAFSIVFFILIMLIPLPTSLINFLIVLNFALTLMILMITIYINNPLEFSVFPSVLLILTLFDLALNISITRMILLRGEAGEVVHAFGEFVVGGNVIVGIVVFIIITIVQFVVITRGAERVAEVAARFTLDAMPGKQMSIDADLNAGLISNEEARIRRKEVEDEADFYGAMDGASKFVKGNVIAAIIIIIINIIGGIIIGYLRGGLSLLDIVKKYTILTIGEGLVSQIPALLVAVAMGIIVTRAASKSDLGSDFTQQISKQPKALRIVVLFLYFVSFVGLFTQIPSLPFLLFAIILHFFSSKIKVNNNIENISEQSQQKSDKIESTLYNIVKTYPIEINLGYGLLSLIDENKKGNLLQRLKLVRENLSKELGFLLPTIRVKDLSELKPNEYLIKIRGNEISRGEIMTGYYLAMKSNYDPEKSELNGIITREPTFDLPAIWILEQEKEKAEKMGFTVVDSISVLATHLTEIIKNYSHEIFTRKELLQIFDIIKSENSSLIDDLVPNILNISDIETIFKNLLKEKISLRDVELILETLLKNARKIKDLNILTENVREALSRTISDQFKNAKNHLTVLAVDPKLEKIILENIKEIDNEIVYTIEPNLLQKIIKSISTGLEKLLTYSPIPLIVCSPNIRLHLKKITEKIIPQLNIISYNEIDSNYNVESVGIISLEDINT